MDLSTPHSQHCSYVPCVPEECAWLNQDMCTSPPPGGLRTITPGPDLRQQLLEASRKQQRSFALHQALQGGWPASLPSQLLLLSQLRPGRGAMRRRGEGLSLSMASRSSGHPLLHPWQH